MLGQCIKKSRLSIFFPLILRCQIALTEHVNNLLKWSIYFIVPVSSGVHLGSLSENLDANAEFHSFELNIKISVQ